MIDTTLPVRLAMRDLGKKVTINGKPVTVLPGDPVVETGTGTSFESVEIFVLRSDYPSIDKKTDVLEFMGETWRQPALVSGDADGQNIKWRRAERPVFQR